MQEFISYVILGIPAGCVFGLVAVGLVLTYKTSGVFNLAFAAQAFLASAVYYDVHVRHEWPILPAFVLAVFVVSPLLGLILDRFVFRWLRGCSPIGKLVSSLGLLVALPEIVKVWLGPGQTFGITGIWWDDNALYHFGDYVLDGRQMAILVSTAVAVVLLLALFRWTAIGLQMRAVVESPRLTELAGVNADRASSTAWMLSSTMAGLAGVLLAPYSQTLNIQDFTTLLVTAIAAAAFARLTSIPMALLGGILLGIASAMARGYLPPASLLAQGIKPTLPFAALFLLLLFWPGLRNRRELTDPLSGADPPPPSLASASRRTAFFTRSTHILGVIFVGVVIYVALVRVDDFWLSLLTRVLIFSVIFLSITVITGMAGQISLCQATFAAVGAVTTAQFVSALGSNVLLGMVAGAAVAAAVGALLAIPVLRLAGIYLSLATLAFALLFDYVLIPVGWIGGGPTPITIPRPVIGPFDLSNDKSFFVFCLIILVLVSVLVIFVRRGTTGHYLDALRGSETAAQSIGINPSKAKVIAFALSAGIAGLGGGLVSIQTGRSNPTVEFGWFIGLVFVVIVVSTAARTVEGAINAGIAFILLPYILTEWIGLSSSWAFILFGFGAIQYARHPEGTLENGKRTSTAFFQRQFDKLSARRARSSSGSDGSGSGSAPAKSPVPAVES